MVDETKGTQQQETTSQDVNKDIDWDDPNLSEEEIEKALQESSESEESQESDDSADEVGDDATKEAETKEAAQQQQETSQKSAEDLLREQIAESRAAQAQLAKTVRVLESRLEDQNKLLVDAGLVEENSEEARKMQEIQRQRDEDLKTLEEVTRLNPNYADYDEVVTTANTEALVAALTDQYHSTEGSQYSRAECELAVRESIEAQRNPYRFKYDAIKALLAEEKQEETPADTGNKSKGKLPETKDVEKKPVSAPASVQNAAGGENAASYTATRLDSMSEEELEKVPEQVREAWLQGNLK